MSMTRIVIGTFLGVLLASLVLYIAISYWLWHGIHSTFPPPPVPGAPLSFQEKMLRQDYLRDHVTHRWYSIWAVTINNGCVMSGPPLETTFHCNTPLKPSDGIRDEE